MGLIGPIGRKGLLGSVIWDLEVLTSWWALKKLSAFTPRAWVFVGNVYVLLFVESLSNVNCHSHCTTYHWVVTNAEEAHHFNVCRN